MGVSRTAVHDAASATPFELFQSLSSSPKGLTEAEAAQRLTTAGDNRPAASAAPGPFARLGSALNSPFVALLSGLGVVFVVVGDIRGWVTVAVMVVLSVALRYWQRVRSDRAMRALRGMVTTTATVRRRADEGEQATEREVPVEDLVPGDQVVLAPGDLVPADVRLLSAQDLLVDQSALSGETLPVRKRAATGEESVCHAGTSVVGGSAIALVVATGDATYLGSLARRARARRPDSSVDSGVRAVGWTLIRFMLVLVPIVLVVNGTVSGDWVQAALFAVSVAVGLTPEMLPVIVTTTLARGAANLARRKVIVKRLDAIGDLGGMDVLCVDKTGTLTEDRAVFAHGIDLAGALDREVTTYAFLAAHFQSVPHNRLDEAITEYAADSEALLAEARFSRVDELPFDHDRRLSTVVVKRQHGEHILIAKGDPDEVLTRCSFARRGGEVVELTPDLRRQAVDLVDAHHAHGMRILAIAARQTPARLGGYGLEDESELVLVGFVAFADPVKATTAPAVRQLAEHGVAVKVLTGDSPRVVAQVCEQAGIDPGEIVLGEEIHALGDAALAELVRRTTVFAKVTPQHKARIVAALREDGHTVGFVGDGVNDAAALRIADVGISVDTATDVAKEAADLVLLDSDLTVLAAAVVDGRRTLGNTMKYVKITAASNVGNVSSVLVASAVLPFLPMLPIQLMVQNLLYDAAQLALPWDRVDADYLRRPRTWDARGLTRFVLVFGPLSSLFDLATFAMLWWVLGEDSTHEQALFQTGWFVEGLLSQVLVVLVLRGRGLSLPSRPVLVAVAAVVSAGLLLPFSPLGSVLRMHPLPLAYFPWLVVILLGYLVAARLVKDRYVNRTGTWL
ncbi:magnesium-translocating P-type ATPase [Amycolatopsis anabasis]|uniref:magnesium-translocating P-type ATPase n=1 Tax=Amycolatopsis anabasis TaxID=1840409 RepID=UPI00131AB5D7|nr:magnesium-translocating P-type ATPase [Amycolatopsis anabasis]